MHVIVYRRTAYFEVLLKNLENRQLFLKSGRRVHWDGGFMRTEKMVAGADQRAREVWSSPFLYRSWV
jgi:hypothetical protein